MTPIPHQLAPYLADLTAMVRDAVGPDLVGVWLIGSAAQDAYEHDVSDVDVLAGHVVFDYDTSRELAGALTLGMTIPRTSMI